MIARLAFSFVLACVSARGAAAGDHGIEGRLRIRDPARPLGGDLLFAADDQGGLTPSREPDPRVLGATLEILGNATGDGATGVIPLAASRWTAEGMQGAPTGYVYRDPSFGNGVRRVAFRAGASGGRLRVTGGGAALTFRIRQAQGPLELRFRIGDETYCARFTDFSRNDGKVVAGNAAAAPATCPPRVPRCGNRVVEDGESCDDGNSFPGDGCSPICALEDRSALCAGIAEAPHERMTTVRVASGLDLPTHVAAPPLDPRRLFVVEQSGTIRVLRDGVLLAAPFLALPRISCCGERGLLSMAFHPQYAANSRFFVYYTDAGGRLVISRFEASGDPDRADSRSERVLLRETHPRGNHNGGQLAFGPDGYLYAGFGDGGGAGDPDDNGQDPASLLGKVLRIDVDVEGAPFRAVPPTNPDPDAGSRLGLIWALGVRNPWRFSFDRLTGDLYMADVGQNAWEEIDLQPAASQGGENYGWDVYEARACFEPALEPAECPAPPPGFVAPVLEYPHDFDPQDPNGSGCSVTGGFVYRGCRLPGLRGEYFFSDYCTAFLRTFRGVSGGVARNLRDRTAELAPGGGLAIGSVTSFGEDARGEMLIVDQGGEIFQIVPAD